MSRVKRIMAVFCACVLLTACGEQKQTGEVLLYTGAAETEKETAYEEVTVKKDTYEETVSGTGEMFYTTENTVSIYDDNAYLIKMCVKCVICSTETSMGYLEECLVCDD